MKGKTQDGRGLDLNNNKYSTYLLTRVTADSEVSGCSEPVGVHGRW